MPLFSGRGFNQSAQAGFQQGFAAQVQMMLQARAEQIQRDLQAERLKAEADVAAANRQAQMEAQDRALAADAAKTKYTEGMAGIRQERDILSRENLASLESTSRVADRLAAENAATARQDKQLSQQQSQFDAEMQAKRDEAAQRAAAQGEQIGMQREQLGNEKTRLGLEKDRIATENKRYDTAQKVEVAKSISALLERHSDKQQGLVELIAKLNEGSVDDYRKTIGQLIAGDPTGMMEKKYGPILQGIVQGTGDRVQASIEAATDFAKQHLASNDPALKILMDAAPEAVDEQLRKAVESLATSQKETLPKIKEKPKSRTDLGPLEFKDTTSLATGPMSDEAKSAASRGEASIVINQKVIPIEAPFKLTGNDIADAYLKKDYADKWPKFIADPGRDEFIQKGFDKYRKENPSGPRGGGVKTIEDAMALPSARKQVLQNAYNAWEIKSAGNPLLSFLLGED